MDSTGFTSYDDNKRKDSLLKDSRNLFYVILRCHVLHLLCGYISFSCWGMTQFV